MASATTVWSVDPDRMMILVAGEAAWISPMALSPLSSGKDTSSRHASGWCSRTASTASPGRPGVATTS